MTVAGIRLPDSHIARAAEQMCREASPRVLYAHAARSFVFAALLADRDKIRVDKEALYVGCILHDLGFTPSYQHSTAPVEVVSADAARELATSLGWTQRRTADLHRAIVLHMADEVDASESAEVRMLAMGVAVDVSGHRLDDIDAAVLHEVLLAYPRGPFVHDFSALIRHEAQRKPESAAAAQVRHGLLARIQQAPFG
jgi:hypothetical protein